MTIATLYMTATIPEQLLQQLRQDGSAALRSPIWQLLQVEDPGFARKLSADVKLELLRHCYKERGSFSLVQGSHTHAEEAGSLQESENKSGRDEPEEDELEEEESDPDYYNDLLSEVAVDLDPWQVGGAGVAYPEPVGPLEHEFELGLGWWATLVFTDCDLEMRDVGGGCAEKMNLREMLSAYFEDPSKNIREVAREMDLNYEDGMSPVDGDYFRFSSIELTHASGSEYTLAAECLGDELNSDRIIIDSIDSATGVLS